MINIDIIGKSDLSNDNIIRIVEKSLFAFGITNATLEIIFQSEAEIAKLNNQFRAIDKPTDVLSFPQIEIIGTRKRILGSIVISEKNVALKDEKLEDVIKHGILHLLGFDHETDEPAWDEAAQKINCNL